MSSINKQKHTILNLKALQFYLGGNLEILNGINTLNFNNLNGKGSVSCLNFDDGLVSINIDVLLTENFSFPLNSFNTEIFHFIYCLEGVCSHSLENSTKIRRFKKLQTTLLKSSASTKNIIHIKPNKRAVINVVCIDKEVYFKNRGADLYCQKKIIFELINSFTKEAPVVFGTYNLKISAYIKALIKTKTSAEDKITEQMEFKGISYFILASHIEQLYSESVEPISNFTLTTAELKRVSSFIESIKTNPQKQYTIEMLCGLTMLSPAKLQEGFKILSNRTVSDCIRNIRLLEAERLIKNTDLNISEIVYSIGFTSRSYFCKIFKEKYGCSPKKYKKSTKSAIVF